MPHSKQVPYAVARSHTCGYRVFAHVKVSPTRWYLVSVGVIFRLDTAGSAAYNVCTTVTNRVVVLFCFVLISIARAVYTLGGVVYNGVCGIHRCIRYICEVRSCCTVAAAVPLLYCAGAFEIQRCVRWNRPGCCVQDGTPIQSAHTRMYTETAQFVAVTKRRP